MEAMFTGLLFFPITPYQRDGGVDLDELAAHVGRGVDAGAGGVFVACGTGEFSALEPEEYAAVVRVAVAAIGGRVPAFAGAGGPVRTARRFTDLAMGAGADGVLLLPPYLTEAAGPGLVDYVRTGTTEEVTQRAYRAIGVPLYSSAAFAFAPQVALAYYHALEQDDQATLDALE